MYLKYRCTFYSDNQDDVVDQEDTAYKISIFKKTGTGSIIDFSCTSDGFTLNMDGGNDSMLSPIKTTSLTFNFILDSANIAGTTSTSIQREIIDDVLATAANSEGELSPAR